MLINKRSIYSGIVREKELDVTFEEYNRWKKGELIQNACPRLNVDEREFVMTGMTKDEWDELFPKEDEEEDAFNRDISNAEDVK